MVDHATCLHIVSPVLRTRRVYAQTKDLSYLVSAHVYHCSTILCLLFTSPCSLGASFGLYHCIALK